jgi:hypothetical protein
MPYFYDETYMCLCGFAYYSRLENIKSIIHKINFHFPKSNGSSKKLTKRCRNLVEESKMHDRKEFYFDSAAVNKVEIWKKKFACA